MLIAIGPLAGLFVVAIGGGILYMLGNRGRPSRRGTKTSPTPEPPEPSRVFLELDGWTVVHSISGDAGDGATFDVRVYSTEQPDGATGYLTAGEKRGANGQIVDDVSRGWETTDYQDGHAAAVEDAATILDGWAGTSAGDIARGWLEGG